MCGLLVEVVVEKLRLPYSNGIQEVYQVAAVTNCYTFSDLKQYECVILQFWKPEVQDNSDQTKRLLLKKKTHVLIWQIRALAVALGIFIVSCGPLHRGTQTLSLQHARAQLLVARGTLVP